MGGENHPTPSSHARHGPHVECYNPPPQETLMTKNRILTTVGAILVALVVVGTSVHAAAGPNHGPDACPVCMLICCVEGLFG
jgi:hypothetical protein